jgi:hypothetical protein
MFASLFYATDANGRYVQVWEDFAWRLEDDDLFDLADALMRETLRVDGPAASMKLRPAVTAVWRRLNRRPRRADGVHWLTKQIERALPVSLRLADDLLSYWVGDGHVITQVAPENWPSVRRAMLDKARETFTNADTLLRVLTDDEEGRGGWALVHFVRPPERRRQQAPIDIEPWDREWLAPLLLDAARLHPRLIIKNLIHIVGEQNVWAGLPEYDDSTLLERVYKLHPEHVDTIFGKYAVPLLELIAHNDAEDDVARSAAIQAKRRLAEIVAERASTEQPSPSASPPECTNVQTGADDAGS